jgi:uncharacterized membrane protein
MLDASFRHECGFTMRSVQFLHVARDALVQWLHPRLELAAVDRHGCLGEQLQIAAQDDEFATHAGQPRIVLKSGINRPVSQISSTLRWVSRSKSLMSKQQDDSLPSCIAENIEVIIGAEQAANRRRSRSEAIYESVGDCIGTLTFVAFQLMGVILWVVINAGLIPPVRPFDPFPCPMLNQIVAVEAVLMTAFVLMRQNRMSKLADRCAHLNLQINLLTERATTKCIGMLLEIGKRFDIQRGVRRGEP